MKILKSILTAVLSAVLLSACTPNQDSQTKTEPGTEQSDAEASVQEETTPPPTADKEIVNEEAAEGESDPAKESREIIQEYGFQNGYSVLSYTLLGETLLDCGDYYSIEAVFARPVSVPGDLEFGDTCEFVVNDFTGEKVVTTYSDENRLTTEDGYEYYYRPAEDGSDVILYCDSDDRVDSQFYRGVLHVRKDAVTGAAILQEPYETITEEQLTDPSGFFNGVAFDEDGMVTELIFFGD